MEFPDRGSDLSAWVQSTPPADLHQAVRNRLSPENPMTGQRALATYLTEEDVQLLVVFLRMSARRGDLTWEAYFEQERAVLDQGNLRMGLATGGVQVVHDENGVEGHEARIPIAQVDVPDASYQLKGHLVARIHDDGAQITFHLHSFAGTIPVANMSYPIKEKVGDVDVTGQVPKQGHTWMDARAIAFARFHELYTDGDEGVRAAVTVVLPPQRSL